ncbi:MAG: transcription-repair coupling factor, partial [Clostridiales bacterium]|nr:transcription-repair coupling factor [Clostridiales bacterium]
GFRVAMRDLELRGTGNILGSEQSGHMLSIGYELYCKLVEETVAELRGEISEQERIPETDASIELGMAAYIPQSYISDEITRLAMYKRIASVRSDEDMMEISDELIDRFSDIPQATLNLMDIAYIHNMASRCGVTKLALQQGRIVLQFEESNCLATELLVKLMDEYGARISFFGGVKPRIALSLAKLSPAKESQKLLNYMIKFA